MQDPKSTVEVMLGAMALSEGKMNLEQFEASMLERKVPKKRREDVLTAISELAQHGVQLEVDVDVFD